MYVILYGSMVSSHSESCMCFWFLPAQKNNSHITELQKRKGDEEDQR